MAFFRVKYLKAFILIGCLSFGFNALITYPGLALNRPAAELSFLRERIDFAVKWSFIPLLETYMETSALEAREDPIFYRLTHQAAKNTFWNDRMESIVNSKSLLPSQMETLTKDGDKHWKDSVVFDRDLGIARFSQEDRQNGGSILSTVDIDPRCMDPLSAFYYLRKRLSPSNPYLELKGITSSRGSFAMRGRLVAEESIEVPAGTFETYRLECTLQYWTQSQGTNRGSNREGEGNDSSFTLWVTQDENRFPVQIRYALVFGSLWVKAISVQHYDQVSRAFIRLSSQSSRSVSIERFLK